jgi:hypothetical protein
MQNPVFDFVVANQRQALTALIVPAQCRETGGSQCLAPSLANPLDPVVAQTEKFKHRITAGLLFPRIPGLIGQCTETPLGGRNQIQDYAVHLGHKSLTRGAREGRIRDAGRLGRHE